MSQHLKITKLNVCYGKAKILTDVSCQLARGELVALIGANGAGKSTLMRSVLGIVAPTSGTITLEGKPLAHYAGRARGRMISYAPQGAPVFWPLDVRHVVGLGRIPHLSPWRTLSPADETAIEAAMVATETNHLADRIVTTLSGGERARVMLARAMVAGAPYLLADEPVASLDPYHQLQVMDILKASAHAGTGVLVVLHDLALAMRYADRVILLHERGVLADGSPADVLTDAHLAAAFNVHVTRWSDGGVPFILPTKGHVG